MKKVTIILCCMSLYGSEINAQWEGMEIDVLNNWGPTTRVDVLNDDGSLIFYGGATPVDTNGQTILNGFLLSTYSQGIAKDRLLLDTPIYSVVEYQGDTIIAGAFHDVHSIDSFPAIETSIERVLVLNNDSMQQLGSFNASCRAKVIGDYLYIFGWFSIALGDSCNVIRWDGQQWEPIGPPLMASHHEIADIAYYNDELYIAGNIVMDNGLQDILVLKDGEWQGVGEPIETGLSRFNKLVVYDGELYAAGDIRKTDGFAGNMIQRWNGEIWQEVGNSLYFTSPSSSAQVKDMKVHAGHLYVSGAFYTAGWIDATDMPGIARWDGSQWCGLYTQGAVGQINSFAFADGELYVRQQFDGIPAGNPAFVHRYLMGDEVFPCTEVFTGTDEVSTVSFSVFPNPTSNGQVQINTTNGIQSITLSVFNITGQVIFESLLQSNQNTIDISTLPPGIYVLQIMSGNETLGTEKLVVQ